MYNTDTELVFPERVIPTLRSLRSIEWDGIVNCVLNDNEDPIEKIGFTLMMIRLGGCMSCSAHSFRAMRGCTVCAQQTIRRFRGTDQQLIEQFKKACQDVGTYLEDRQIRSQQVNLNITVDKK